MNVPPLAAHLFVFYYGALADVTPPTALSSYTAAGIAGADPQRTTWIAWKLAMAGFIIPYYFAFNPALLLNVVPASLSTIVVAVLSATLGTVAIAMALQGWALQALGWPGRITLAAAAVAAGFPGVLALLAAGALLAGVLAHQRWAQRAAAPVAGPSSAGG
jgi:TRAP-type uncharacterized transport system fused permease subunit